MFQKRAAAQNLTFEEVENNVNEQERERQRRKRIRSRDKDMGQNTEGMTHTILLFHCLVEVLQDKLQFWGRDNGINIINIMVILC